MPGFVKKGAFSLVLILPAIAWIALSGGAGITMSAAPSLAALAGPPTPLPPQAPTPAFYGYGDPLAPTVVRPIRIGIIAGHYRNDPGSICPNGVREVDVNLAVAKRVIARLTKDGYEADLLGEFDPRLKGYQGDVVLSLHSDSCEPFGLSGFKVARSVISVIPDIEDRLVECLTRGYRKATGMAFEASTITDDMLNYHAFRKVEPSTPAAIIEMGFMSSDLEMLLHHQDRLAAGIVDGIESFLNDE